MARLGLIDFGMLLVVASLVAMITRRIGFPYTAGLVLAGIALPLLPEAHQPLALVSGALALVVLLTGLARAAAVYPISSLFCRSALRLPATYQHVLVWGGLRGAVGLALALAVPASIPEHRQIVVLTFGVVAFSIFFQGLTMPAPRRLRHLPHRGERASPLCKNASPCGHRIRRSPAPESGAVRKGAPMSRLCATAAFTLILAPAPAAAEPVSRLLVSNVGQGPSADMLLVEITMLRFERAAPTGDLPQRLQAQLRLGDEPIAVVLERVDPPAGLSENAGTFAQASYALRLPATARSGEAAILSLGTEGGTGYAFSVPDRAVQTAQGRELGPAGSSLPSPPPGPIVSAKPDRGNAFLANLSSYAPIYAVYGPGTDSDARLQISFKYQLFGEAGAVGRGNPAINNIHLAVTQRMFWDLGKESTPFRNIDFIPEIFYLIPAAPVGAGISLGGQAGLRHESNGRDGLASRTLNALYVQPVATMPVGAYTLSIGPRLDLYLGSLKDNPDIVRYRGHTSLFAELGQDDGLRLTTNTRFNFATGKGAIDATLSYPLDRIAYSGLNLYLIGQAFTGYGENLLDYDRGITRLRVGVAIVR